VNLRLAAAKVYTPHRLRVSRLRDLFALTAEAFGVSVPDIPRCRASGLLESYARFTGDAAAAWVDSGRPADVMERLRNAGFSFGAGLRRELGIRSRSDVMEAARLLYRFIGIDFRGEADGRIVIRRCLFSGFYSPEACLLMSALDDGVVAGLAGGGSLVFTGRITGGGPACEARFFFPENTP
jgi:hypothetical protein